MPKAPSIRLSRDAALVLFEWLSELSDRGLLKDLVPEVPVRLALETLLASLEETLVEPFDADYRRLLAEASARLEGRAPQD